LQQIVRILIDRCRLAVAARSQPKSAEHELAHGIPIFLDQLISALSADQRSTDRLADNSRNACQTVPDTQLGETALLHGRDLLKKGFTLEQVIRDYGDVCQAVTNLAIETGAKVEVAEFRTFNRCLDNAIAGAVTEYANHSGLSGRLGADSSNPPVGALMHELRNYLDAVTLVVAAIKVGNVGISGTTGAVLDRSLLGMRSLIDRALAELRVNAHLPPRREAINLAYFLHRLNLSASYDPLARGTAFTITPVAEDIVVYAAPEILAAALGSLLQNAFTFTKHCTEVRLRAHVLGDRVLIEVEDRCGGLPAGAADTMFLPFTQSGDGQSGRGLGLDISRRSIEANGGKLSVHNLAGIGCIFTIDLPRLAAN
jgi:signal transduction histidine kinase